MSNESDVPPRLLPPVAVSAKATTQLLNLPEELLLRVFKIIYDELLDERSTSRFENDPFSSRLPGPYRGRQPHQLSRQQLVINRHLYTILRTTWDGYLSLQASEGRAFEEPLPALSCRVRFLDLMEDELSEARTMRWHGEIEDAEFYARLAAQARPSFAFLCSFSGLITLRATFVDAMPCTFTDALRRLPLLQDLILRCGGVDIDDVFFTLGEVTPRLRRFAIAPPGDSEVLRQLLTNLPLTLEEVHIFYTFPAFLPIPWYTVPRLHLYPPKGYFRDPYYFIEDLNEVFSPANPRQVKVEELAIQVLQVSLHKSEDPEEIYYEEVIPSLLEAMQPNTSIKHLHFINMESLEWWENDIRIPSVEAVTLHEGFYGSAAESRANLESIVPFLTMFPSLRILTFSGFLLLSDECDPAAPIPPGSFSDFVQREERLAELLEDIQHSSLVELNYRTSIKSKRELRLRREGPGKEWDGEWWTV